MDRATTITRTVRQITSKSSILEAERWLHVENVIRDELDDVRRELIAERRMDPDA